MFIHQHQYVFVLLLLAAVVLGGVLVARAGTGPLFEEVAMQPEAPLDMAVSRQRLVRAHPQALASLLVGDTFSLELWPDARYEWQIMHVEADPFGKRVWSGRLKGLPYGQALFVFDGTSLTAHINTGQRVFQVRPWQNGLYLIEEIDQRRYPQELPPLLPGEQSQDEAFSLGDSLSTSGPAVPSADDGSQIDVMVLYTPAARAAVGGVSQMEALINLAVAETNQAYQNSGVTPRLNLVHMQEVAYTESGSFSTDLSRLRGTSDGYIDAIHGWRDTYHADLVSLIIEDTQYCGLGYFMDSASSAFASWGFTVVARTCATGYYSFGHELGHNMGLQHDWYVDDATYQYTYSHGHLNVGGGWRTIMSYNSECSDSGTYCTRLQYFSNPNNTYNGAVMGVPAGTNTNCVAGDLGHPACDAEAYHVLNNNAYTVANFRVAGGTPTPTSTPIASPTATPPPTVTPSPTVPTSTPGSTTTPSTSTPTSTPSTSTPTSTPSTSTPTTTPSTPAPTITPSTPTPTILSVYLPLVRKDAAPTPTLTPSPTPTPVPTSSQFSLQVIDLANQARQNAGCAPLTVDNRLMAAAQAHSEDMALNDFFSHTSLDGTEFWERILAQGYNFSIAGENIAAGYTTPQDVMDGWMNSQGHRDNILNCAYQDIGVGYYYLANDTGSVNYYHYWTMDLAAP